MPSLQKHSTDDSWTPERYLWFCVLMTYLEDAQSFYHRPKAMLNWQGLCYSRHTMLMHSKDKWTVEVCLLAGVDYDLFLETLQAVLNGEKSLQRITDNDNQSKKKHKTTTRYRGFNKTTKSRYHGNRKD